QVRLAGGVPIKGPCAKMVSTVSGFCGAWAAREMAAMEKANRTETERAAARFKEIPPVAEPAGRIEAAIAWGWASRASVNEGGWEFALSGLMVVLSRTCIGQLRKNAGIWARRGASRWAASNI